jgi:hypothetical protein
MVLLCVKPPSTLWPPDEIVLPELAIAPGTAGSVRMGLPLLLKVPGAADK